MSYSVKVAKPKEMPYERKDTFLQDFQKKDTVTESEILLMKRRLNNGKYDIDVLSDVGEKNLTPEQTEKGKAWLMKQYKTPTGKEKENSPFGYRETEVLDNFDHFELVDWYDDSNYFQTQSGIKNYQPVYRVVAKDGSGFEYTVKGGEVYITG